MTRHLKRAALAGALLFCPAALGADTTPVSELDLERYLGTWYETARYENIFQRGLRDAKAVYERLEDGTIRVTNSGTAKDGSRKSVTGTATKEEGSPAGELQVSFIPPHALFSTAYRVLYITPDYEGALVSNEDGDMLWLLQRSDAGKPEVEKRLLAEAVKRGFDTQKLIFDEPPARKDGAQGTASEAEVDAQ